MSDKSYTPPNGANYQITRNADGSLQVKKEGEKGRSISLDVSKSAIDASTSRLHVNQGETKRGVFWVYAARNKRVLSWPGGSIELDASDLSEGAGASSGSIKPLKLTMPGKVLSVKVKEGDVVEIGQGLVIVEAMKMENLLLAQAKAKVAKVHIQAGDRLESGATLITFAAVE